MSTGLRERDAAIFKHKKGNERKLFFLQINTMKFIKYNQTTN